MSITPFSFLFFIPFFLILSLPYPISPSAVAGRFSGISNRTGPGCHLAHGIPLRVPQQTPLHPRAGLVPLPSLASSSCGVCSSGNGTPWPRQSTASTPARPSTSDVQTRSRFRFRNLLWKSLMQFMLDFLSFFLFFCLLAMQDCMHAWQAN